MYFLFTNLMEEFLNEKTLEADNEYEKSKYDRFETI